MAKDIEGTALVNFEVAPDGERFRLNVRDTEGGTAALSLPTECLHQLVMTLPRMAVRALQERHGDKTLRLVYPLGGWNVEQAAGGPTLILTLRTPDGFEVAFGVREDDLAAMGDVVGAHHPSLESRMRININ